MKKEKIYLNSQMRKIAKKKLDANIISQTQYKRIIATIKKIEKENFSHKEAKNITSDDIQQYLCTLKNYSNSVIKKVYEQFNQAYKYLESIRKIDVNPMNGVYRPQSLQKEKEIRALSIEEEKLFIKKLISSKETEYSLIYLIQLFMGLRISEVLALEVTDINFNDNIIQINKVLTRDVKEKLIIKNSTKTISGNRNVPIPRFLRKKFKDKIRQTVKNNEKMLFLNKNRNYIDPKDVNKRLKNILSEFMNSSEISSHNLRHTYITRCVESGINPKVLMKLVGHKDIDTTLGIYTTVFENYTKSEIKKIQNYYKKNKVLIGEIARSKSNNWLETSMLKSFKNRFKILSYQIIKAFKEFISFQ